MATFDLYPPPRAIPGLRIPRGRDPWVVWLPIRLLRGERPYILGKVAPR